MPLFVVENSRHRYAWHYISSLSLDKLLLENIGRIYPVFFSPDNLSNSKHHNWVQVAAIRELNLNWNEDEWQNYMPKTHCPSKKWEIHESILVVWLQRKKKEKGKYLNLHDEYFSEYKSVFFIPLISPNSGDQPCRTRTEGYTLQGLLGSIWWWWFLQWILL